MTPATILFSGCAAGALHVFMGPDHLAAVAPLAFNQRRKAWLLGIRWGLGHAAGVILVAVLAWSFRELLPVELFSSHCERLVGVMLIGIGFWGLRKASKFEFHLHEHSHGGAAHQHLHAHNKAVTTAHVHPHAALAVGILHGLAGGSHFLGVLPALAMPTRAAAGLYLMSFGLGTIGAMAGFSFLFGFIGSRIEASGVKYFKGALASSAAVAIAIGGYWILG